MTTAFVWLKITPAVTTTQTTESSQVKTTLQNLQWDAGSVIILTRCFFSLTCFIRIHHTPLLPNLADVGLAVDLKKCQGPATLQDGKHKTM